MNWNKTGISSPWYSPISGYYKEEGDLMTLYRARMEIHISRFPVQIITSEKRVKPEILLETT